MEIFGRSKVYGIIGNPVSHSLSPIFWNAAFKALGHQAVYVPFLVKAEHLSAAMHGLAALSISGINVTKPFKEAVLEYMSELVPPAQGVGAVNSVKCLDDGTLIGANTDATAFLSILRDQELPRSVMLLGAGGAAKAVLWGLCQSGVETVYWSNRNESKMHFSFQAAPTMIIKTPWNDENLRQAMEKTSMIINATSLGWNQSDSLPVLESVLGPEKMYLDLNYGRESSLLRTARKLKAKTYDGLEFLLRQGFEAFRFLTGEQAPETEMRQSLMDRMEVASS